MKTIMWYINSLVTVLEVDKVVIVDSNLCETFSFSPMQALEIYGCFKVRYFYFHGVTRSLYFFVV